jgi:hypothetical protein
LCQAKSTTERSRDRLPSRKVVPLPVVGLTAADSIEDWAGRYLDAAVRGVRSVEVADRIALHLARFADHFTAGHGHDRLSAVVRREVVAWRTDWIPGGSDHDRRPNHGQWAAVEKRSSVDAPRDHVSDREGIVAA